jgi:hypothetical protein
MKNYYFNIFLNKKYFKNNTNINKRHGFLNLPRKAKFKLQIKVF